MDFAALFIVRPVATSLLTLALVLAGGLAFFNLPVAALPQVDFPTISVQAQLPGASAETMAATVAMPLERALGRIAGVTEMTSSSTQGATQVTLQFELSRDLDGACRDVQAAINAAASLLPSNMPSRPSYRRDNPADSPIIVLALTSELIDRGKLYDAASTILAQKIAQIPGVGLVQLGGAALPAVRIELNPTALRQHGVSLEEVRQTVTQTNVQQPKGVIEIGAQRWQIQANDQARQASDYLPLVLRYRQGATVRIADVGTVVNGVEDLRNIGLKNGKPSVLVLIKKQPVANVIETVDNVLALLPMLRAALPKSVELSVVVDRSLSIRASLKEVGYSLLMAIGLVMLVVLLFLRNFTATLIPIVVVPVSLLGTFSIMYFCQYSLNNLTLMALTIATGFVVDDAIVLLENTKRHIERGVHQITAAQLAVKEVGFTVLVMSLSLVAVFLPILLMGGVVGRLFREFAVTLSVAVLMSLLISLTLTPMLCARWLHQPAQQEYGIAHYLAQGFNWLQHHYERSLRWALRHSGLMLLLLLATIGLNLHLYKIVPKGFFPTQDSGRLFGELQVDQSASFWALQQKLFKVSGLLRADPAVSEVAGFAGSQQSSNSARIFVVLKPLAEREAIEIVHERLRKRVASIAGVKVLLFPVQELRIGGRPSLGAYDYALQADDLSTLRAWTPKIQAALAKLPLLKDVNSNQQDKGQQINLTVDRELAARYGISQALIDNTLNNAFGQRQVGVIYNALNQYRVVLELAPEYWQDTKTLEQLYIHVPEKHLSHGTLLPARQVPLASIAHFSASNSPLSVNHQGQFAVTTLSFNLQPGTALSAATELIESTLRAIQVPTAIQGSFQGAAKAFQDSLNNQPYLILAALLSIYVVLGVLYESYMHPLTILSTLPSAGVGALLALMLCDTELSIIAFIGIILLIGIVKKNAILMIDFALHAQREQGLAMQEAIFEACRLRFRPIVMTTMAALFGALPLALSGGYGAELRRPLGIAIVGGLLLSQLLTLYTTPVVYRYVEQLRQWLVNVWH